MEVPLFSCLLFIFSFPENFAVLRPSSFYLIIKTFVGIQIQIQLNPLMQISVTLDPEYQGDACGKLMTDISAWLLLLF